MDTKLYDSEPGRLGFDRGTFERCNGRAVCARGVVEFDGEVGKRIKITIETDFETGRDIAEAAVRQMATPRTLQEPRNDQDT